MSLTTSTTRVHLPLWRAWLVVALLLLWFVALLVRSLYLQVLNNDFLVQKGDARYSRVIEISAHRGMITDRHGEPLAISTPVESVWASPQDIELSAEKKQQLARLLDMSKTEIDKRLANSSKEFAYLKRGLPPEQAAKVMELGIPGVFLQRGYRRYYPAGDVTAHVLGFTGVDDNGQEGLELTYQKWLAGQVGSRRVIKDRPGHIIEDVESIKTPQEGRNLALSIDRKIQYLAFRELKAAVDQHQAKAGAIVVLDAKTRGDSGAGQPALLQPQQPGQTESQQHPQPQHHRHLRTWLDHEAVHHRGRAGDGKIHAPKAASRPRPAIFPLARQRFATRTPRAYISVAQVIQKSSNVGSAKMALTLQPRISVGRFQPHGVRPVAAQRLSRRGKRQGPPLQDLASHRAGHHVLRPRHFRQPAATGARLHRVRQRRRAEAAFHAQAR